MKKIIQLIAAIKSVAAFAFTAGIMLITVATMIVGEDSISISIIWQVTFLALIFGALQLLAFSETVFRQMNTRGRMTFLCISMFVVLALFALAFRWFPAESIINWLIFIGLYGGGFAIAVTALRIVFHIGGLKYDELLMTYKSRNNNL